MTGDASLVQSDNLIQPLGRKLIVAFYAASQALRIYPVENATVQKALDELYRVVRRLLDRESALNLKLVGDFIFLNDARLRLDLTEYLSFSNLAGLLQRHGVGEIEIEGGIEPTQLAPFLALLLREGDGDYEDFERFVERLRASPVRNIHVEPARDADAQPPGSDDQAREAAKRTYFQSVHVAREVLTDSRLGRAVNLRRVKRAVQSIVDEVLNNESSMIGMTTLREYDEYTFTHCVNVSIFSVVLGQRLGLSRLELYELGFGALLHDIGKQRTAPGLLGKASGLSEQEWLQMQQHPTDGLLMLFSMRGISEMPYRAMLMAYEHHMKIDLTGYPRNTRPRSPALFSRIVAVADGFDAATSRRSYQQQPWPPDEVLREMRDNPKRGFDQLLVKALINVIGVFPVGTLCILDTQELAVVIARNPDPAKLHQPIVKIVSTSLGIMLADPPVVDLAEIDAATGRQRRAIIKTTQPEKYGIRISDYFI
jgi:HD-GYP domain-containing protein (c-di-GMP phosphodiesterase class II)